MSAKESEVFVADIFVNATACVGTVSIQAVPHCHRGPVRYDLEDLEDLEDLDAAACTSRTCTGQCVQHARTCSYAKFPAALVYQWCERGLPIFTPDVEVEHLPFYFDFSTATF